MGSSGSGQSTPNCERSVIGFTTFSRVTPIGPVQQREHDDTDDSPGPDRAGRLPAGVAHD